MYESPITLLTQELGKQIAMELDEATFKAVFSVVPTVDKEELIRALRYDREQYDKGYADGKADARAELVRCKDCKYAEEIGKFGCYCRKEDAPWFNDMFEVYMNFDDFCSYGERKDGDGNEQNP